MVEQRMTAEPRCWGGVSHPLQLTTGLVIKIYNNQSQEEEDGLLQKNDESAHGATRGEMYLLVPPCGLLLTAA